MARDFEDHCWKDIVDADTIQIYQAYRRKIYVGEMQRCSPSTSTTRPTAGATGR